MAVPKEQVQEKSVEGLSRIEVVGVWEDLGEKVNKHLKG